MADVHEFCVLPAGATAAGHARDRLRRGCGRTLSAARLKDAELLVSELVTNALRYGLAPVELAVRCSGDQVVVRVRNRGAGRPELLHPDLTDEHGRGLVLLDVISDQWGVQGDGETTTVWFTLRTGLVPSLR